jgi:hypothetical protein
MSRVLEGGGVIMTPEDGGIDFFQLASRKAALKLECLGMKHSRGSVYAVCKKVYGLKGNKQSVLAQMEALVANRLKARETQPAATA